MSHVCVSVFPSVMTGWEDLSALPTCLPYLQNSLKIPGDGVISVQIASFKAI